MQQPVLLSTFSGDQQQQPVVACQQQTGGISPQPGHLSREHSGHSSLGLHSAHGSSKSLTPSGSGNHIRATSPPHHDEVLLQLPPGTVLLQTAPTQQQQQSTPVAAPIVAPAAHHIVAQQQQPQQHQQYMQHQQYYIQQQQQPQQHQQYYQQPMQQQQQQQQYQEQQPQQQYVQQHHQQMMHHQQHHMQHQYQQHHHHQQQQHDFPNNNNRNFQRDQSRYDRRHNLGGGGGHQHQHHHHSYNHNNNNSHNRPLPPSRPTPQQQRNQNQQPPAAPPQDPNFHPCVAQFGACKFGPKCKFSQVPSDVCLHWLNGDKCRFSEDKCKYNHKYEGQIAEPAPANLPQKPEFEDGVVPKHPCMVQFGKCQFGEGCRFSNMAGDVCTHWLSNKCHFSAEKCLWKHSLGTSM